MLVSKKKYQQMKDNRDFWFDRYLKVYGRWQALMMSAVPKHYLTAAESALRDKEDVIEELQAEVYELTCEVKTGNNAYDNLCDSFRRVTNERDSIDEELNTSRIAKQKQVEEATARAERAEAALASATKISYVVALHERDVPALPRYTSLDSAFSEYMDAVKPVVHDNKITSIPPYRIFALRGDEVIADVTDPSKWDETLPVSEKRAEPEQWRTGPVIDWGHFGRTANMVMR